jgi:hypothetical protein
MKEMGISRRSNGVCGETMSQTAREARRFNWSVSAFGGGAPTIDRLAAFTLAPLQSANDDVDALHTSGPLLHNKNKRSASIRRESHLSSLVGRKEPPSFRPVQTASSSPAPSSLLIDARASWRE